MNVFWLAPLAWAGLALLTVPIVVHLLARQRSRRVLFPTLRFLPASQLAALRRRAITNWPLLAIRLLIVTVAVAAVAAPVFVSDARRAEWDARIARAIVVTGDAPEILTLAEDEARTSFASAQFGEPRLPDAIRAAATWLNTQPPAARELVIVGDVREGALASADWNVIPQHAGVRFLPVAAGAPRTADVSAMADVDGQAASLRMKIEPDVTRTRVTYADGGDANLLTRVRVLAAPDQQAYADAMLRAVLREGVLFDPSTQRSITVSFGGVPPTPSVKEPTASEWMRQVLERHPEVRGSDVNATLVLHAAMPVTDARAPALLASVLRTALTPSMSHLEPRSVSPAQLAAWSRPLGASPPGVLPADEGDRRWFWGAALLLLALEHLVRRRRRHA